MHPRGVCRRVLKLRVLGKVLWGKLLLPTGLGKSDCPG